jgi:selenide, water dikinase
MLELNEAASVALEGHDVHALTDVTGYGLLGHAWEMAAGSQVTLHIDSARVPFLDGVIPLAALGAFPGAVAANRRMVAETTAWKDVDMLHQQLLLDPQTSGGLLIALPPVFATRLEEKLRKAGIAVARIGSAGDYAGVLLEVT